jgi:hypothetical protein
MGFELRNHEKVFKMALKENNFSNQGFKEDVFKINIPLDN